MEFIILVPGLLYAIIFAFALIVFLKKDRTKIPVAVSVLLTLAAVVSYLALILFGLPFLHIMKFGIMSNRLPTAADLILVYALYLGLIAGACVMAAAGYSGKDPKAVKKFFIFCMIIPLLQVILALAEPYYKNVNFAGLFKYASMKKFEIAGLRWGMQETNEDKNYRYSAVPAAEMCGRPGKILFKRFNYNKKLYGLETIYETVKEKDQAEIIECVKNRFGKPYQDKTRLPSCGCYVMRWRAPDTEIEALVYDEEITGEVTTRPYSMVAVNYNFMPPYLKDKTAVAYKGY